MARTIGLLATVVVLTAATSAVADIIYTPVLGDNVIGVYRPGYSGLWSAYVTSGQGVGTSDTVQMTFGFHLGFQPPPFSPQVTWMHFSFWYDSSSLEVLGARSVGPIATGALGNASHLGRDTYSTLTASDWPNPNSGIASLSSLAQGWKGEGGFTDSVPISLSAVVPFFQVTLHVKAAVASHVNSFAVATMTMYTLSSPLTITPGQWNYGHGAVHEIPEPTSAMLVLGLGAVVGGRVIRRKRRAA
jgi:hypothetical protein